VIQFQAISLLEDEKFTKDGKIQGKAIGEL